MLCLQLIPYELTNIVTAFNLVQILIPASFITFMQNANVPKCTSYMSRHSTLSTACWFIRYDVFELNLARGEQIIIPNLFRILLLSLTRITELKLKGSIFHELCNANNLIVRDIILQQCSSVMFSEYSDHCLTKRNRNAVWIFMVDIDNCRWHVNQQFYRTTIIQKILYSPVEA